MDLLQLLASRPLIVGDGAMGSQLMERGLPPGVNGELWNLENPDAVRDILAGYVQAGADFVITNTFGANGIVCSRHGIGDMCEGLNQAGVEIARSAAGQDALVLGGLGPTGGLLEPYGQLTERQVRSAYREQVAALARAGVDGIIAETFESGHELRIALEAAREACDVPLLASMKFNRESTGRYRSMMGDGPQVLAEVVAGTECAAAGSNCGKGIEAMIPLVEELSEMVDRPLLVEPNAGVPELVEGKTRYPESPDFFRQHLPALYEAGARIIGGCCGTTPGHIAAVREFADGLRDA